MKILPLYRKFSVAMLLLGVSAFLFCPAVARAQIATLNPSQTINLEFGNGAALKIMALVQSTGFASFMPAVRRAKV